MEKIKFDNIKGYKEEIKELSNLCYLIKNREELAKRGGKLPRGVFLIGPNGVGKTVLSKAFIAESGCKCVEINYNDLDDEEKFTEYIKTKFKEAANLAPCILFIDELDKLIGNDRKFFMADNFDKSRVLLNEINRYINVDGLFILTCGNKDLEVDYSVIRSGRIDKIIQINLPNQNERKEILDYYVKGKSLSSDVDLKALAKVTKGFSGADIETLINNALIKVFTDNRKEITNDDLMSEFYDKVFSSKSKKPVLEDESLRSVAIHEAGHAVATLLLDKEGPITITVLSRDGIRGFSGTTENEHNIKFLEDKKNEVVIALAGLSAELGLLGKRNDGSKTDIKKAREIVRTLVRHDGIAGLEYTDDRFVGEEIPQFMLDKNEPMRSEEKQAQLEKVEDKLLMDLAKKAATLVLENEELIVAIADELMVKKLLNRQDIDRIVGAFE